MFAVYLVPPAPPPPAMTPASGPLLPFDPVMEAHRQWVEHGWGHAADGMAAVTSVMRARQILLARIEDDLRPFDLSFARYELLMLLHFSRTGSLPLGVIGSRLQVHPTSVTSAVDRLEGQQMVVRRPHPTDRRTKLAEITAKGRETCLAATEVLNAGVFSDPGLARLDELGEILRELRRGAGDFE